MNRSSLIIIIFIISTILNPLYGDVSDFRNIIEDYLSVSTIKASITQHIYLEDGSTEVFSGNYYSASGGMIRIDYLLPEIQTVIVNNSGLFWYYNNRKLLFISEKKGGDGNTIPVLMSAIPSESLRDIQIVSEGLRLYSVFKMAEVYSISSKKNKTKMMLWVDPLIKNIRRKCILDESGREMVKEDYSEHVKINGIYIPSRIELKARTLNGVIHTVTEYDNIVINSNIDKGSFKFKITPEMKVRNLSE